MTIRSEIKSIAHAQRTVGQKLRRIDYSDGSFMLSWLHCRAWLAKQGEQEADLLNRGVLQRMQLSAAQ